MTQFRPPRFSVRRMMIAIAVVAIIIWPATVLLRWEAYRRIAQQHEQVIQVLSSEIASLRKRGGQEGEASARELVMFRENREAERYRLGMQRPRRLVDPLPPESNGAR